MQIMESKNSTAIITGTSGGLGKEIAVFLGKRGFNCLCHYGKNAAAAQEAADAIRIEYGREALAVPADLGEPDCAEFLIEQARQLGPIRLIINSASVFQRQPAGSFTHPQVSRMLAVNLAAPLHICDAFVRYLKQEGLDWKKAVLPFAAIINMVDIAGLKPWAEYAPYCAARAGLIAAVKSLAKELAPGIAVNAVAPGIVALPGKMDPAEKQKQLKMIPVGRFGNAEDITRTIEFLLDNFYITGQVLCVDGGRTI